MQGGNRNHFAFENQQKQSYLTKTKNTAIIRQKNAASPKGKNSPGGCKGETGIILRLKSDRNRVT